MLFLTERLKCAEAARKRLDEELTKFSTENVTREEIRKSLEVEVRRLTQTVGQTKGEKREKEERVARCEAYIDGWNPNCRLASNSSIILIIKFRKKCHGMLLYMVLD